MRPLIGLLMGMAIVASAPAGRAEPVQASVPGMASTNASPRDLPAIDPSKGQLLERYFNAINLRQLVSGQIDAMARSMIPQNMPEEERRKVADAMQVATTAVLPVILDDHVRLYAEAFTVEELEGLVAFYESPIGRSLMEKTAMLSVQSGSQMPRYAQMFESAVCSELGC